MEIMKAIRGLSLPSGFGFRPNEVELCGLLQKKAQGLPIEHDIIPELDVYKHEPWDLPAMSHPLIFLTCSDSDTNPILYFFTPMGRKYPTGPRANRCTQAGYWKITCGARTIEHRGRKLCIKKTLVFHLGRPPPSPGTGTEWIMHEYSLHKDQCKDAPHLKDLFALCRVTRRDASSSDIDHSMVLPLPNQLGADHLTLSVVHPNPLMPDNSSTQTETLIDSGNASVNQLGADHLTLAVVHPDPLIPGNSLTLAETLFDGGSTSVDQLGADQLAAATVHPNPLMPDNSSTLAETLVDSSNTSYHNQPEDIANWLQQGLFDPNFTPTPILIEQQQYTAMPETVGSTPSAPMPEPRIYFPSEGSEDEYSFLLQEDIQSILDMPDREGSEDETSFLLQADMESLLGMLDHQNAKNGWILEDENACTISAVDINPVGYSNEDHGTGIVVRQISATTSYGNPDNADVSNINRNNLKSKLQMHPYKKEEKSLETTPSAPMPEPMIYSPSKGSEDKTSFLLHEDIESMLGMLDNQNTQNGWFLEDQTACTSSALDINVVGSSNEDDGTGIVIRQRSATTSYDNSNDADFSNINKYNLKIKLQMHRYKKEERSLETANFAPTYRLVEEFDNSEKIKGKINRSLGLGNVIFGALLVAAIAALFYYVSNNRTIFS